ncbi:MAG: 50S ribosomal protein L1 [Spirochaetaceae bacterium]
MRHGKKYIDAKSKVDRTKRHELEEAVDTVKGLSFAGFDETLELSVKLNLKKGQSVRDTLVLPNQFKAEKRVLVFAKGEKAEEAREAGAAYVGDADLVEKIQGGWLDFDVAVATPDMMKDVGKLGPILGRRGLMPNPKTQTVTFDLKEALDELKKGRVEYRSDKTGVVHFSVGKVSMDTAQVTENIRTVLSEIDKKRTADSKGEFLKSVYVASTMGPGVKIEHRTLVAQA